jgi:Ca2+-binding RTX toxin-like protein
VLGGDADSLMSAFARGGNDYLEGGLGENYLVGDSFDMIDDARGGDDHLVGGEALDWMIGDADGLMAGNARGGNDVLEGRGGNDELRGDNGYSGMIGNARGGNDLLNGGSGDDLLIGDGASMSESAVCGNDIIIGGTGNDQLYGDADPLQSDLTDVALGRDRFVFANGSGLDSILDFGDGWDLIDLTGFNGIAGFAQVGAESSQAGGDIVIDLGAAAGGPSGADILRLAGVGLASLDAADFVFG